ncbi:MAG TPA: threonine synthase [Blastocatellia bacterium]|nr:threonine synthase [Blastocatellia bacterium]
MKCTEPGCGARFPVDQRLYSCRECGGLLDVEYSFPSDATPARLKQVFEDRRRGESAADLSGVWRFRELLPFTDQIDSIVSLREGNTPLYEAPRSADYCHLSELRLKHQGMNPTGSFKDNGMTTGVTKARLLGATSVACASTGNTSASMAAYAARAGMRAYVFIPAGQVAYGKLSQALEYGATVVQIDGNFDDALTIVRDLGRETDLYLLNSINPFRLEGQKTIMFELIEQLEWQPPDWIVLPGGNLGNAAAFGKALHELVALGFIERAPRLAVIQAEGSAPFYNLVRTEDRSRLRPVERPATLATAIRIGNPVSWKKALRSLDWTNGVVERVSEQEIADAKAVIGRDGIGCEPASAATLAGAKRLVESGTIERGLNVVCVLTGNLLKDPSYTIDYHTGELRLESGASPIGVSFANQPIRAAADREEIRRVLGI